MEANLQQFEQSVLFVILSNFLIDWYYESRKVSLLTKQMCSYKQICIVEELILCRAKSQTADSETLLYVCRRSLGSSCYFEWVLTVYTNSWEQEGPDHLLRVCYDWHSKAPPLSRHWHKGWATVVKEKEPLWCQREICFVVARHEFDVLVEPVKTRDGLNTAREAETEN